MPGRILLEEVEVDDRDALGDAVGQAMGTLAREDGGGDHSLLHALQLGGGRRLVGHALQFGEHQLLGPGTVLALEQLDLHAEPAGVTPRLSSSSRWRSPATSPSTSFLYSRPVLPAPRMPSSTYRAE